MNAREHLDESLDGFYNGMPYDEIKDHVEAALALLANRWAAFTDDELLAVLRWANSIETEPGLYGGPVETTLYAEMQSELARRRS